jgi:recombination protein RecT
MTTDIATKPKNTAVKTLQHHLESPAFRDQVAKALPKHLTPDRFIRIACTTVMRTPKLAQCDQASFFNALLTLSQLGLEPDGRRAHLIPFENRKRNVMECQLIIDWKGLAELVLNSGTIATLHADLICDNDEFAFDMGEILHHRINFKTDRGTPYAAYALAKTKTGEKFVQVMTKAEIEGIRDNSQGWRAFKAGYAKQSPWQDSPGEMWKKTVFRRLCKWLPLSPEIRDGVEKDDEPFDPAPSIEIAKPIFGVAETAETPLLENSANDQSPAEELAETKERQAEPPKEPRKRRTNIPPPGEPAKQPEPPANVAPAPEPAPSSGNWLHDFCSNNKLSWDDVRSFMGNQGFLPDADSYSWPKDVPAIYADKLKANASAQQRIIDLYAGGPE